jgi:hypothetical protein
VGAHCQDLAQPSATFALENDVPARLKLQVVQGRLKRELAPIHRCGQWQNAVFQHTTDLPVLVHCIR